MMEPWTRVDVSIYSSTSAAGARPCACLARPRGQPRPLIIHALHSRRRIVAVGDSDAPRPAAQHYSILYSDSHHAHSGAKFTHIHHAVMRSHARACRCRAVRCADRPASPMRAPDRMIERTRSMHTPAIARRSARLDQIAGPRRRRLPPPCWRGLARCWACCARLRGSFGRSVAVWTGAAVFAELAWGVPPRPVTHSRV